MHKPRATYVFLVSLLALSSFCLGAAPSEVESKARPTERPIVERDPLSPVSAAREMDKVASQLRAELRGQWHERQHADGLDEELERATNERLKDAYFEAIDAWGESSETCEPDGVNRRWLPRLIKEFGRDDVIGHREEISRILGALAAERLAECTQPAEERALRAERELTAFVVERLRLFSEFLDGLESGRVRVSTKSRIRHLQANLRAQRPLADRSVSVGFLRMRTAASQSDSDFVAKLEADPAFQKPFQLNRALAQLKALRPSTAGSATARVAVKLEKTQPAVPPANQRASADDTPVPLSVPWLLK